MYTPRVDRFFKPDFLADYGRATDTENFVVAKISSKSVDRLAF